MTSQSLTQTLEYLEEDIQEESISLNDIVAALNHRGFGPLLMGPALIATLPTGAIPGIPSICAITIILVAGQTFFGRRYPWIPSQMREAKIGRDKFCEALKKAKPYTKWVDSFFSSRLQFLTQDPAPRFISGICVLLALSMIPLELVPFAAAIPSFIILLFGLALSVKDGLITLFAIILSLGAAAAIPYILG